MSPFASNEKKYCIEPIFKWNFGALKNCSLKYGKLFSAAGAFIDLTCFEVVVLVTIATFCAGRYTVPSHLYQVISARFTIWEMTIKIFVFLNYNIHEMREASWRRINMVVDVHAHITTKISKITRVLNVNYSSSIIVFFSFMLF